MLIPADARRTLLVDGATVLPSFLSAEQLEAIDAELEPWLRQIAWSDTPGYALRSRDKWLDHVGLCSPTLIRVALDERLLDFFASLFGEEPIVAEFSIHDSVTPNPELPFHSDRDGGLILYLMLTHMDASNGIFSFIPGTQNDRRFFFVPDEEIAPRRDSIVPVVARRGDAVFFDQDIWHHRAAGGAGRRVVRLLYQPASRPAGAVDHLYRQTHLAGLSERQLRAYGIGQPPFQRPGRLARIGRPFRREDIQTFIQYLRRFRQVDLRPAAPKSPKNVTADHLGPRIRVST